MSNITIFYEPKSYVFNKIMMQKQENTYQVVHELHTILDSSSLNNIFHTRTCLVIRIHHSSPNYLLFSLNIQLVILNMLQVFYT
ncbi:hypothetical protein HanRHA438_Chr14g0630401 [Helianthus annuus]|uniref:Uncharacterized protein n=1 Tax=Helianthus annuus TaxID=4232 RepID=A0A9K3H4I5_HELAN|nr:hypothetical protein HanXRQr2_Chr14g0620541 [Helianthus annuus]KAJ0851742.1 hypothetical protein HanRHA438_Chr14g0630401 [Helianthus annuus]